MRGSRKEGKSWRPIAKTSAFSATFKWAEVTGGMAVVR